MSDGEQVRQVLCAVRSSSPGSSSTAGLPWLHARVRATRGFEEVRPLLEEDLRALEHIDDDVGAWEAVYENIRSTVQVNYPEGQTVPEFLLHVHGEDTWWRWSNEPFT